MSNAKQEVLKLIQKKRDKIRNARRRLVRQEDVYNIIVDFIKDVEKATKESISVVDFDTALVNAAQRLNSGISRLDPSANVKVVWTNDQNTEEKWNELQVENVVIIWSDFFSKKTGRNKEETIDIGHLFIEGYFD